MNEICYVIVLVALAAAFVVLLMKKWGITEEVKGIASMALGYPDCENPEPRPRREGYYKIIK